MNSLKKKSLLKTPVYRLFLMGTSIMFISELLIMYLLPLITSQTTSELTLNLLDASLLTLITSVTFLPLLVRFRRLASDSELALEITSEGYWNVAEDGRIVDVNQGYCQMVGYSREQILEMHISDLDVNESSEDIKEHIKLIISNGRDRFETIHRHSNGKLIDVEVSVSFVPETRHFICFLRDFTDRKKAEIEIENLAFYDPLTRLPNRRLLFDNLKRALASSIRSGRNGALLFLDIDHFKTLNDTLGHAIGDLLLQQVAERLTACLRGSDTISRVARLGGDEFVVMLENLSEVSLEAASQTKAVGEKILFALNQTYELATHEYQCTASIGVAFFSDYKQSYEEVLKYADIAMYQAKKSGRNTMRFFDPHMQDAIHVRVDMERELRIAFEQHQFELYYQIQVDELYRPFGAEALIRWIHPERGLVPPLHFIQMAEEVGLILPIGQWVLETACAQLKMWELQPYTRDLTLSVNVSAKQFHQVDFVEHVKAAIKYHGISPNLLKIELTESLLLEQIEDTILTMNSLREIGIKFSLDDFGTGYSSLQYLKRLPLTQLKIDQSFVRDIAKDSSDRSIVQTIIAMAHNLNLKVIAEGVETEEQRELLLNKGCKNYQGYLFGKPLPIEQFEVALYQFGLLVDMPDCKILQVG
jgi:diguanylate cyclase (GGDEF)-like protein/PAS domain S-box-containing protein